MIVGVDQKHHVQRWEWINNMSEGMIGSTTLIVGGESDFGTSET